MLLHDEKLELNCSLPISEKVMILLQILVDILDKPWFLASIPYSQFFSFENLLEERLIRRFFNLKRFCVDSVFMWRVIDCLKIE